MVKSIKGQFFLSIAVALGFIINSFNYTDFSFRGEFNLPRLLFYLVMIISVYNAGMLTQQYMQSRKEKSK
ncbi:hypothetical protein U5N28_11500 [Lysinibacillus telephonicus]|uniref:Uncharacterized protein n=1 Tax=Lysinibacillus telephonicus TaxID=1714840 RepID=A0A3S0JUJ1_9BACI|nr:hypothetical protein [Lysinibacillus telephonicus]RTQ96484.1 hypothetical protein EKG35_00085 [Lysinibacillus telephonicus]